jgi:hypothetical protein
MEPQILATLESLFDLRRALDRRRESAHDVQRPRGRYLDRIALRKQHEPMRTRFFVQLEVLR